MAQTARKVWGSNGVKLVVAEANGQHCAAWVPDDIPTVVVPVFKPGNRIGVEIRCYNAIGVKVASAYATLSPYALEA